MRGRPPVGQATPFDLGPTGAARLAPAPAKRAPAWRPAKQAPRPDGPSPARPRAGLVRARLAAAALAAGAASLAASARSGANEGRLSEALKDCDEAIAADKLTAGYRYLQATILGELDRDDDAVKALNSTLYLDPRFVLAHFLYGNIARRRSRTADADSHFRTTLSLLEELSPTTSCPSPKA